MSTLRYLSRGDLLGLGLGMPAIIDAVDAACRRKGEGGVVMPPKLSLHGEGGAFSQAMAAGLGELGLGVKWVTIFPSNAAAGRPLVNGLLVLSDSASGEVTAALEAGVITAWRTGASAAVAARYLARREVECLGLLGAGVQGRSAAAALAAELPGLRTVRCHDPVAAAVDALEREMLTWGSGMTVERCSTPADVVRGAGVVVSAITMAEGVAPPLGAGLLEPGALAVALDYDAAWSGEAMAACDLFYCDDTSQLLATKAAGVRLAGIPDEIAGDLGELAAGRVPGRAHDDERLFCMNLGMAVEDVAVGLLALTRAREVGAGSELPV